MYRVKSFALIVLLIGAIVVVGLMMSNEEGITGGMVAKTIACYDHKDCDDRIEATKDICKNPGTKFSLCVNQPKE